MKKVIVLTIYFIVLALIGCESNTDIKSTSISEVSRTTNANSTDTPELSKTSPPKQRGSEAAPSTDTPELSETSPIKQYYGRWKVVKYLGHSDIYSDEENENEIVGKELDINADRISFNGEIIISPIVKLQNISYDDVLSDWRTNPNILGINQNSKYDLVIINDANNKLKQIGFIKIDKDTLVLIGVSKYYKMKKVN